MQAAWSLEFKRIFNAGRGAGAEAGGAILKNCYVASRGDVTGVTSGVTCGEAGNGGGNALAIRIRGGQDKPYMEPYIQIYMDRSKVDINQLDKWL